MNPQLMQIFTSSAKSADINPQDISLFEMIALAYSNAFLPLPLIESVHFSSVGHCTKAQIK
jgi:hypothetical protein